MKRKFTIPVIIATTLVGCANNPTDLNRMLASDNHSHNNYDNNRTNDKYDGPPSDTDRHRGERHPGEFNFCDKYKNETAKHALACTYGVDEAQRMAEGFAGGHGREEGYIRGYAWGMNKMERYAENNPDEINLGERDADGFFSRYSDRAQNDGAVPGNSEGNSLGNSEAQSRFYSAVDTNKFPSSEYTIPMTSYQGVANAYAKLIGPIPTVDDFLRESRRNDRLTIFEHEDRVYMNHRDHRQLSVRDVWNNEGTYQGDSQRWLNGDTAFEIWKDLKTPGKNKYDTLNSVAFNSIPNLAERIPAQVNPADGNRTNSGNRPNGNRPNQGQNPNPVVTPVNPPNPSATPTPMPSATPSPAPVPAPVVDYQGIFKEAFIQAYSHFAPYFYSHNYYENIDEGQRDGELTGFTIGSEIAHKKGLARGFDVRYMNASRLAYIQAFGQSFTKGFSDTFNYYKTNTILSLNFLGIVGNENDGVVQPGEDFSVRFKVINVGGVSSSLNYTVNGDVINPQSLTNSIAPISSKIINSNTIGEIDPSLEDGSNAKITLQVNELKEQMWQKIQRPIEFADYNSNYSILTGSGLFNIDLVNIASVDLNGKITLDLKIAGVIVKTVIASAMKSGDRKSYSLDFSGIDPLTWINSTIPVEIDLKYNDMLFGMKSFTLSGGSDINLLASYFDLLANDKGTVPKGKSVADRLNEVKTLLIEQNKAEVSREIDNSTNVYRTNQNSTIPGKIFLAKSGNNSETPNALSQYTSLSDQWLPNQKDLNHSYSYIQKEMPIYILWA